MGKAILFAGTALCLATSLGLADASKSAAHHRSWDTPTLTNWDGIWVGKRDLPGGRNVPGLGKRAGSALPVEPTPLYAPYLKLDTEALDKGLEVGQVPRCLPPGVPTVDELIYPAEIITLPKEVHIIYELGGDRRIRINGKHPDYLEPTYRGDSIGRWEGDTLVIDTVALTTKSIISGGARHSIQLRVTERLREIAPNVIDVHITMRDPLAFAKPVDYHVTWERAGPNEDIQEQTCDVNHEADDFKNLFDAFDVMPEPPQPDTHWAYATEDN